MTKEINILTFAESLVSPAKTRNVCLQALYTSVIDINSMIGLHSEGVTEDQKQSLINTYGQLCEEEGKELDKAVKCSDKVEFLDAVVDYLVVGGFYWKLCTGNQRVTADIHLTTSVTELIQCFTESLNIGEYLSALVYAEQIFFRINVDHEKAIQEVLQSNLSKFPKNQDILNYYKDKGLVFDGVCATSYQEKDIESRGRYSGVYSKVLLDIDGVERVSFWSTKEYGILKEKYLKPCTFKEPDFKSCWRY